MPRTARRFIDGACYHVLNRGNRRERVFHDTLDYATFVDLIARSIARSSVRVLAYCLMPNHVHLLVWPHAGPQLTRFMHWLLTTHVRRHHRRYGSDGRIWQGRFKAFPVEQDEHLIRVLRYIERNPMRARLVGSPEDWPWSSLRERIRRSSSGLLGRPPVALGADWLDVVRRPETRGELDSIRTSANCERPFGTPTWSRREAARGGLSDGTARRGRPRASRPIGDPSCHPEK